MSDRKPVIGFIGVGLMGHGMAKNIVTKGYPLVVMGHRNREPVEHLLSLGAKEAKTAREVAAACDIVHLCVTGSTAGRGAACAAPTACSPARRRAW